MQDMNRFIFFPLTTSSHSEIGLSNLRFKEKLALTLMNVPECHYSPTFSYPVFQQINQARSRGVGKTKTFSVKCPQRRTEKRPMKEWTNTTEFAGQ